MSRATTCPQIIHDVQNYKVVEERAFSIPIAVLFSPQDGTLKFYLKNAALPWLHLDTDKGVLSGIAPKVSYTKQFKFTLTASNDMGFVTKSFILVVVDTEIVETMPQTLENILSMRYKDYGYSHLHPYTPSLLEYLYHFFQQQKHREAFIKSVHDAAKEHHLKISEKVTFKEFDTLLKTINPDIELILQHTLDQDHVLTEATLDNETFENLFREGSQIPGSIDIPIWNHCGNPNLFNWPEWRTFSNVLHAAADAVIKLQAQNLQHQNAPEPRPR